MEQDWLSKNAAAYRGLAAISTPKPGDFGIQEIPWGSPHFSHSFVDWAWET
jgi:hypothetical protein